jgi:hypothetical protein
VWSVTEQDLEGKSVAAPRACNCGGIIDAALFGTADEIGPVRGISQCVGLHRERNELHNQANDETRHET